MNPTVSIIIPVYNAEKYLRRCIESILNQEYADMIGADFYGKDAMQSVYYAQNVFGEES